MTGPSALNIDEVLRRMATCERCGSVEERTRHPHHPDRVPEPGHWAGHVCFKCRDDNGLGADGAGAYTCRVDGCLQLVANDAMTCADHAGYEFVCKNPGCDQTFSKARLFDGGKCPMCYEAEAEAIKAHYRKKEHERLVSLVRSLPKYRDRRQSLLRQMAELQRRQEYFDRMIAEAEGAQATLGAHV